MKGCLVTFAALVVLVAGAVLPTWLIDNGLKDFEGRERKMARDAFFYVATYYGESFLDYGDYIGPPLVTRWRIEDVEGCPGEPTHKEIEGDSYRALVEARDRRGVHPLRRPRGEVDVTCEGRRNWDPYF